MYRIILTKVFITKRQPFSKKKNYSGDITIPHSESYRLNNSLSNKTGLPDRYEVKNPLSLCKRQWEQINGYQLKSISSLV